MIGIFFFCWVFEFWKFVIFVGKFVRGVVDLIKKGFIVVNVVVFFVGVNCC